MPLAVLSPGGLLGALVGVVVTLALSVSAIRAKVLTPAAAAVAGVFGIVIVLVGGPPYLAMLILFVLGGTLATRYGWEEKKARKVAEGKAGERGVRNVLSHIVVPMALVLLLPLRLAGGSQGLISFVYVAALACGTADTFASEFGVLSGKAVNILGGGPVKAGTNGGVSVPGELWALVGSLVTIAAGAGIFFAFGGLGALTTSVPLWFAGGTFLGFLGCQIDSVLGATLENRGLIGKGAVNFLAMLATGLLAAGIYYA
ncbi:MAG: DUF92 domain-containing protein [Euryarchaeota archaeon]|nr:DUF92 domain-containing protein [Euryarchaeota archaeon]MDE1836351.1 DUF92 domain-containing protein [Euryarchaeota archaeon]MDE1879149.1 DUF92 domain-containing protein [Euryarchaeota archaeon]MDE2044253.1 DUF92 domain-containing protein [Thermoplasmata archaeon]